MAACLEYQAVYCSKRLSAASLRIHLVAASLLLVALLGRVWIKIETTSAGYELAREHRHAVELDMQRRELELELSVLLRPDMLSAAAKSRLGMGPLDVRFARRLSY